MNANVPEIGGRFLFERLQVSESHAEYRLTVTGEGEMWRGTAQVALPDGEFDVKWEALQPPEWMHDTARAFLKTQLSAYTRADGTKASPERLWPRRIHRWRAPRGQ